MHRLLFNSDGDSVSLSHFPPPIAVPDICRSIDELHEAPVDVFLYSLNRGGDTYSHQTEAGEVFGAGTRDWTDLMPRVRRKAENIRHLLSIDQDPLQLHARKAHDLGMAFWPSLRMNDIHEDDSSRFSVHRSTFKQQHPELLIGAPYPDPTEGYPRDDYTWAFDYKHREVRARRLALVEEVCSTCDISGFELDFSRGPWYFRRGEEESGAACMTELVHQVRQLLDRHARVGSGRPTLAIRVPPRLSSCEQLGLDVKAWLQAGHIDVCTPMSGGYLDSEPDVASFRRAAPPSCRIAGGLERSIFGYGGRSACVDVIRSTAASLLALGADDLYLFNYDCHRKGGVAAPYSLQETQLLHDLKNPQRLRALPQHVCVTRDMRDRTSEQGGRHTLPLVLSPDRAVSVCINSGVRASNGILRVCLAQPTGSQIRLEWQHQPMQVQPDPDGVWSGVVRQIAAGPNRFSMSGLGRVVGLELIINDQFE